VVLAHVAAGTGVMEVPYREPLMPALTRRVWKCRFVIFFLIVLILAPLVFGVIQANRYLEKRTGPSVPTEEDRRKEAKHKAFKPLQSLSPEGRYAIHCVYKDFEGIPFHGYLTFACLASSGIVHVSLVCAEAHGCTEITITSATQFPASQP
jgi:hypothetical protein